MLLDTKDRISGPGPVGCFSNPGRYRKEPWHLALQISDDEYTAENAEGLDPDEPMLGNGCDDAAK
jgi:hypothetical protein